MKERVVLIGERVMVDIIKPQKVGSVILPDTGSDTLKPQFRNVIVEVGDGETCTKKFHVGDEVLIDQARSVEVRLNGKYFYVIDTHSIVGIKTSYEGEA